MASSLKFQHSLSDRCYVRTTPSFQIANGRSPPSYRQRQRSVSSGLPLPNRQWYSDRFSIESIRSSSKSRLVFCSTAVGFFCSFSKSPAVDVILVASCLTVKGAEDVLNKQFTFELSTRFETTYFIANSEKEKEDWTNSIGRSIVQHSRSITNNEIVDYDNNR